MFPTDSRHALCDQTLQIRVLGPADARAYMKLRLDALQESPAAFASSYAEEVGTSVADIEARLSTRPDGAVFGAFLGPDLVGLCGVQRERLVKLAHKATVWGMYALPSVRGKGIGFKLLGAVLAYAKESLRVRVLRLGVGVQNKSAVSLYERAGFQITGTEIGYMMLGGVLIDEYQMAYRIREVD